MASLLLLLLVCSCAHASFIPRFERNPNLSVEDMRARLMKPEFTQRKEGIQEAEEIGMPHEDIPASFDARQQWPDCTTIGTIYNQASCGSCWAFCTAELMSDRTCIAKQQHVVLSPQDILGCVESGAGCNGGWPISALQFWDKTGVCTSKCRPYTSGNGRSPVCQQECLPYYNSTYQQDKHFGSSAYYIRHNVAAIQKEIMTHGPVSSTFNVYEDFFSYTSGVYVHTSGALAGGHCVKTIGWGVDNGTPYWLVANSWNTNWGEQGFFRILRGTNEVGFESNMAAGLA